LKNDDVIPIHFGRKSKFFDDEIWIGDTGKSNHYCNDNSGLFDYKVTFDEITNSNGEAMIAEKDAKLQCYVCSCDGI
jgi:hypothetical protein